MFFTFQSRNRPLKQNKTTSSKNIKNTKIKRRRDSHMTQLETAGQWFILRQCDERNRSFSDVIGRFWIVVIKNVHFQVLKG